MKEMQNMNYLISRSSINQVKEDISYLKSIRSDYYKNQVKELKKELLKMKSIENEEYKEKIEEFESKHETEIINEYEYIRTRNELESELNTEKVYIIKY